MDHPVYFLSFLEVELEVSVRETWDSSALEWILITLG